MSRTIIVEPQKLTGFYEMAPGIYMYGEENSTKFASLVQGEVYTVVWDSVEYPGLVAQSILVQGISAIALGNVGIVDGTFENTEEPFLLGYVPDADASVIYTSDTTKDSHDVALYQGVESDPRMILLDKNQNEGIYDGIVEIKVPTVDGGSKSFIAGNRVEKVIPSDMIDFSSGPMEVPAAEGELFTKVTLQRPSSLTPENIIEGVEVAGITGNARSLMGDVHIVTFMSEDGTTVLYERSVADGDNCADVVSRGLLDTPMKESTVQYNYTYAGWSLTSNGEASEGALLNVTGDRVVYAAFKSTVRHYTVNFYDGETLVHSESVAYGGSSTYEYVKDHHIFLGWRPTPTNITRDMDCYVLSEESYTFADASWAYISDISERGDAENYFAVGDTKPVHVNGKIGTLAIDETYYVYILGFDHNSELEGGGIHIGTFKDEHGNSVALADGNYSASPTDGTKCFNLNHWGVSTCGGWVGCDMRYDILGSTDNPPSGYGNKAEVGRVGYDASVNCATNPVPNTLMAALPSDLRAVMKPMTKYTDNVGNGTFLEENVTACIDYLPLLSGYEVYGVSKNENASEQEKQRQYAYYEAGNPVYKYKHSEPTERLNAWLRSVGKFGTNVNYFTTIPSYATSQAGLSTAGISSGIAPIFKV